MVIFTMIALSLAAFASSALADESCDYYQETGHSLCDIFRNYWNQNGGLPVFGYPIDDQHTENGLTVQNFERQRFEYHPEFANSPYEVELGRLGAEEVESRGIDDQDGFQPHQPVGDLPYFAETSHNITALNYDYWTKHCLDFGDPGVNSDTPCSFRESLALFGLPISEEYWDTKLQVSVQCFERARFEYHPENQGTPYEVLLGRLGAEHMGPDDPYHLGNGQFQFDD